MNPVRLLAALLIVFVSAVTARGDGFSSAPGLPGPTGPTGGATIASGSTPITGGTNGAMCYQAAGNFTSDGAAGRFSDTADCLLLGPGAGAGIAADWSNCEGSTAIGVEALNTTPAGAGKSEWDVAIGYQALQHAQGYEAGQIEEGLNVAVGYQAANALTSGQHNTAVGNQALVIDTTDSGNTAIGAGAMEGAVPGGGFTASHNVGIGEGALGGSTPMFDNLNENVAVGAQALAGSSGGSDNVAIGFQAAASLDAGANNTYVGANANPAASSLNNCTVIGAGATCSQSNQTVIGGPDTTETLLAGQVVPGAFAVGSLPTCDSAHKGSRATITDGLAACVFLGATTGGGSNVCPVFCDGAAWKQG